MAASALWLAVAFHPSVRSSDGSDAVSSGIVQLVLRSAVAARTRATSFGDTKPLPLPKLHIKRKPESIFDYQYEDFEIVGYQSHAAIKAPVAV